MQRDVAEIKQQGVIEAANDPKSSLTSEDARRKIVEESKKAGNAAFRFDPDATPEQKAAQVQNAIPDGFHRDQKPKGTAVATDIVKGPGEYDLPPPTKAMDADALTKAGVDTKSSGGSAVDDDKARWAKVGWEPRFGEGTVPRDEGDDPTEHQTWVEAHLDEKFFGDWYQNTAVIVFACLASWLVAQLGGGLAWVFIVMAICGTYYRTSLRRVRRNFRDDIRRDLAKAKLETDVESLEWINSFLVKFWPIFQPVLAATVISSVDQVLSTSTPAFLDSLRLTEFTLGSKPPRMEHVKTYPNSQDDIVLMDWKFSFTPNDKMDMTARQLKNREQPKVVLEIRIGKAMISKGLPVIVEDMAFSGLMRFKVKLQIPFPHVEKVEFCFLEKPKLDYVCKPLGGSTFGIDMNMVPGLEDFIQSQIHANLGPIMYAPNVFPIEVAKMLAGNPVDQALGVVAVTLHGAQGLKNNDKFAGTPDPYAILSLNSRTELARTKTVKENASPRWNETKHIIIASFADNLTFQVFDFNDVRKDKELGTASFALDALQANPEHPNQTLEVLSNGRSRGAVLADIHFFPVLEGRKLPDGKEEAPPESNTGIARFTIEQAKELDGTKSLVGALTPYAVLLLNNHEVHKSGKLKRTNNPIWADGSKEMLITDRKSARLGVVIKDDRDIAGDPILGAVQMKLDDMLEAMQKGQEWYNLAGAKTGRAKLTLQWKPVALKGALGGTGGYVTPIGCLRFHFGSAKDLRNLETMGKSDPYVRVLLSGVEKGKTVTFQNDLNPTWDEIMYVPIHSAREKLTVEVMDQESTGKDRSLGEISILASDYVKHDPDGEYLEHVERKQMREGLMMHGKGAARGILDFNVSFYPCMNVADPGEEPEKDKLDQSGASDVRTAVPKVVVTDDEKPKEVVDQEIPKHKAQQSVDQSTKDVLALAEKELVPATPSGPKKARLSPEELLKYREWELLRGIAEILLTFSRIRSPHHQSYQRRSGAE